MTDGQITIIATGIVTGSGTLGALIRAAAIIVRDAMREANEVIRDNTAAFNRVAEMFGRVDVRTENVHDRMVEIHQEISGVHETEPAPEPVRSFTRAQTHPVNSQPYSISKRRDP